MLVLYVLISCLSFISLLIVSASMDQTQKVVTVKAEIATSAVKLNSRAIYITMQNNILHVYKCSESCDDYAVLQVYIVQQTLNNKTQ